MRKEILQKIEIYTSRLIIIEKNVVHDTPDLYISRLSRRNVKQISKI